MVGLTFLITAEKAGICHQELWWSGTFLKQVCHACQSPDRLLQLIVLPGPWLGRCAEEPCTWENIPRNCKLSNWREDWIHQLCTAKHPSRQFIPWWPPYRLRMETVYTVTTPMSLAKHLPADNYLFKKKKSSETPLPTSKDLNILFPQPWILVVDCLRSELHKFHILLVGLKA